MGYPMQMPISDHCSGYYQTKCKILRKCNDFMHSHGLRVVIKRLPFDATEPNVTNSAYCSVIQKRHMIDRMLMNRSFYETSYNRKTDVINVNSMYMLGKINESVMKHLQLMSEDITDPEFSGIWIGIYSKTYKSKTQLGEHYRSKLIAWALVELLTSNERCFKGLWVHPYLNNIAATALLKVFLPRIILASFDASLHKVFELFMQIDTRYKVKLFYVWVADIDIFPRISLVLLGSSERLGLLRHYEHSPQGINKSKGEYGKQTLTLVGIEKSHTDNGNSECMCYCQKNAKWDEIENIIMGCSEEMMCANVNKWLSDIPSNEPNLTCCIKDILSSNCESIYVDEKDNRSYDEVDSLNIVKDVYVWAS